MKKQIKHLTIAFITLLSAQAHAVDMVYIPYSFIKDEPNGSFTYNATFVLKESLQQKHYGRAITTIVLFPFVILSEDGSGKISAEQLEEMGLNQEQINVVAQDIEKLNATSKDKAFVSKEDYLKHVDAIVSPVTKQLMGVRAN